MTSLSYELMTVFYSQSRQATDFEIASAWSDCEAAVNNVHHGKYPAEWLPQVSHIISSRLETESDTKLVVVWEEALELVAIASIL